MITKEEFISAIYHIQLFNNAVDDLSRNGINITESELFQSFGNISDKLFSTNFTNEGFQWINWWLYERYNFGEHITNAAYDIDGNIINLDTSEELWNLVSRYLK